MQRKTSLLGLALCLGAAMPMMAQNAAAPAAAPMNSAMMAMSAQDQLFVTRAAEGNLAEITLAQMALSKTRDAGVRNVASTIIQGHSQAQAALMGLLQRKGMTMPPPMLSPTHMAVRDRLSRERRGAFDKMYMANQTDDHENTIALFQTQVANGQDADLKAYAQQQLPDIVGHTIMIYTVAKQVGAPGSELRPPMPPIPPGVTPTMMGKPIDLSNPMASMMMAPAGDMASNAGMTGMAPMPGMTTTTGMAPMTGMNSTPSRSSADGPMAPVVIK